MRHKFIPLADQLEWEKTISAIPHSYCHTHWYNEAMHVASNRDIFLYAGEKAEFKIICPLSSRQKESSDAYDVTTPYGFSGFASIGGDESFPTEWRRFMAEQNYSCGHIALHPLLQKEFHYDSTELYAGKKAYYLDLHQSLDELYKNLAVDHRHRLRQWEKSELTIEVDKSDAFIECFIANYSASLTARGAAKIYDFGELAWRRLFASPHSFLFSVKVDGKIEASALFILYQDVADYFMISSTLSGRLHARGLIWHAITFCKQKNIRWLHLGCGVKDDDALEQFKARFGGKPVTTFALKQVYNRDLYQGLCEKYQSNPHHLNGYFPSYWVGQNAVVGEQNG